MSDLPRRTRSLLVVASVLFAAFLLGVVAELVPGPAEAAERAIVPQLIITWLLTAVAVVSAVLLARLLLRSSRASKFSRAG